MNDYVADTHGLFWYLSNSESLGNEASIAFSLADDGEALIHIPAIVLTELFYLNIKLKKPIDFVEKYSELEQAPQFLLTPFEPEDVLDFERDSLVSEMHDRMICRLGPSSWCSLNDRRQEYY